jgi:hypothetical protein
MTINDINQAIIAGNFSNDQLNGIAMSIKFARNQLTQQNRRSITVGTQVRFTNSRTGRYEIGTVKEIKIKMLSLTQVRLPGVFLLTCWR